MNKNQVIKGDNYIIYKKSWFNVWLLYVDSKDWLFDNILERDKIKIKFLDEFDKKSKLYNLVHCRVSKNDLDLFLNDLEELKKKMLVFNRLTYLEDSKKIIDELYASLYNVNIAVPESGEKDILEITGDLADTLDGGWFNYRIVEKEVKYVNLNNEDFCDIYYEIYEVYYDKSGRIFAWSENPMSLSFENKYDYKDTLKHIKTASKHKILKMITITNKDGKEVSKLVPIDKYLKQITHWN